MGEQPRNVFWVASSKKEMMALPDRVQDIFGYALHLAQEGKKHEKAKPLKGFVSAGVLEVVESFRGNAYRAVYTTKIGNAIYVLYCFQKKSTKGIKTPKADINVIEQRLKMAKAHAKEILP